MIDEKRKLIGDVNAVTHYTRLCSCSAVLSSPAFFEQPTWMQLCSPNQSYKVSPQYKGTLCKKAAKQLKYIKILPITLYTGVRLSANVCFIIKLRRLTNQKNVRGGGAQMIELSGKYVYTIRSANGVLVENLQVYGKSRADADEKIRQMYWRCVILQCDKVQPQHGRLPQIKMQWVRS